MASHKVTSLLSTNQMPVYKVCRVTSRLVNPGITRVSKTPKLTPGFAPRVTLQSWVNQPKTYPSFKKMGIRLTSVPTFLTLFWEFFRDLPEIFPKMFLECAFFPKCFSIKTFFLRSAYDFFPRCFENSRPILSVT